MNRNHRPVFVVGMFALTVLAGLWWTTTAPAQRRKLRRPRFRWPTQVQNRPRYVKIPIQGDFESILKQMLNQAKYQQEFKKKLHDMLMEQMKNKNVKLPFEMEKLEKQLENMDLKNPLVQQQIKDLLNQQNLQKFLEQKNVKGFQIDPEQVKAFQDMLKKFKVDPPKVPDNPMPQPDISNPVPANSQPSIPPPPTTPPQPPEDDPFRESVKSFVKDLAKSEVGEMFKESPELQKMLFDMSQSTGKEGDDFFGSTLKDVAKWFAEQKAPDWGGSLPKVDGWNVGDMPSPSLPLPKFNVHMPRFGGPSVPAVSVPPPSALAPILLMVFLFVILGVLLWSVLRVAPWSPFRQEKKDGWQLGPWPIDPARLRTAGELILAFNYLSLLLFGPAARSWNHRRVANRVEEDTPERQQSAATLAAMYEQARYAPTNEPLSTEELQQARDCLCSLAQAKGQH